MPSKRFFICFVLFLMALTPLSAEQSKPYVYCDLLGGLGNLMFEVAATCALAWDHDAEPTFPQFSKEYTNYYQHLFYRCNIFPSHHHVEAEWHGPPFGYESIPYHPNLKLYGYYQNEKYFAHHRNRILQLFAPHPDDLRYIQNKYGWLINLPQTVSVHLRYYYAEKPDEFIQYDREYFEKAMSLFPDDSIFVVTSDNMSFARQNIPAEGKNVFFIENEPYYVDFFLQSFCKHNIICNSTFSWWSAWLNQNPNKVVVRPKVWLNNYPDIGGPDEWIKIEARSMQERLGLW